MATGDPQRFCKTHGWGMCNCDLMRNHFPEFFKENFEVLPEKEREEYYTFANANYSTPTQLTSSQAERLYHMIATEKMWGVWVGTEEEYDAMRKVLWRISNKIED